MTEQAEAIEIQPRPEVFADTVIIVIGNNHCWGKGDTLEEALKNASKPSGYVAYIAKANTQVSEFDGSLTWDSGNAPRLIASKGVNLKGRPVLMSGV